MNVWFKSQGPSNIVTTEHSGRLDAKYFQEAGFKLNPIHKQNYQQKKRKANS